MTRHRMLVAAAGLAAGLLLGWILPAHWIFAGAPSEGDGAASGNHTYACPMFCVVMDRKPDDGRCPVCGMQLTEVGTAAMLDGAEQHMIGLRAARVLRMPLRRHVRVVGEVDYDETRLSRVTTRVSGWIDEVWADATWMAVEAGTPLASLYSPELYAAQKELLASEGDATLRAAAERRLQLFGVADTEIGELRRSRQARETLVLRAPRDGIVIERNVLPGASVARGALLYTVADLARVWIQAEVFEQDLAWVRAGQAVELRPEGAAPLAGRVAFVDPVIDRDLRTARVRIEVDNPAGPDGTRALRVGQRVDAWIGAHLDAQGRVVAPGAKDTTDPLVVPRSAVLATGERHVVYVLYGRDAAGARIDALDPARLPAPLFYEMVTVDVGAQGTRGGEGDGDAFLPVLGDPPSLREGQVVVENGAMLLDAQAQLSGRPSLLFPGGSRMTEGGPHAGH